jgi:hypothetical protein
VDNLNQALHVILRLQSSHQQIESTTIATDLCVTHVTTTKLGKKHGFLYPLSIVRYVTGNAVDFGFCLPFSLYSGSFGRGGVKGHARRPDQVEPLAGSAVLLTDSCSFPPFSVRA